MKSKVNVNVGDVLTSCCNSNWNTNFYKVVRTTPSSVELVELNRVIVSQHETNTNQEELIESWNRLGRVNVIPSDKVKNEQKFLVRAMYNTQIGTYYTKKRNFFKLWKGKAVTIEPRRIF